MVSKDFSFHEAMKDSPTFRFELGQHERYFDRMHKRLEETIRSIETVIEQGQALNTSFYNLTVLLNRLWQDMGIGESDEKSAMDTYRQLLDTLTQINSLNRSLVDHAYPALRSGFDTYLKRELGKMADTKAHFNSLSTSLSEALSKKAGISRNKTQELRDSENALTAIGTCFSHIGLDYVAQISIAHALKCPALLEALWVFVKEYGNFFTRGSQIFAEQQEFLIGDAVMRMRSTYKQTERRMQDRHSFVPKEIFQHPSGIPLDPQCIMEGYLFKRATNAFKTWNRRWFMIKEGKLLYSHKTNDGEPEVPTVMEENLKLCLVRPAPATVDRACCFELVTPTKSHLLQADSESLCNAWIRALQRTIQNLHEDDHGSYSQSRKSFIGGLRPTVSSASIASDTAESAACPPVASSSAPFIGAGVGECCAVAAAGDESSRSDTFAAAASFTADWIAKDHQQCPGGGSSVGGECSSCSAVPSPSISSIDSAAAAPSTVSSGLAIQSHQYRNASPSVGVGAPLSAKQQMKLFLKQLLAIPGNDRCADCGCPDAKWTSLNIGAIICIECCGVHRSLGVHCSKVRSLTMDTLETEHRNILLQLGNRKVNAIFLRNLPHAEENAKIGISRHTNRESREQWIIAKYVERKFATPQQQQQQNCSTIAHSRSVCALSEKNETTTTANGDDATGGVDSPHATTVPVVKMRSNILRFDIVPTAADASSAVDDNNILENRLSRASSSSFGSDSNLMQSARAAIGHRVSACFARGGVGHQQQQQQRSVVNALCNGCLEEVLRAMVQDRLNINDGLQLQQQQQLAQAESTANAATANNRNEDGKETGDHHHQQQHGAVTATLPPLHVAVENNQTTMIEFLLLNGAKINSVDSAKNTPLHLAAERGHTIVVYQLLKRNAEKMHQNICGRTALELAVERCHADIVTLLRLHDMKEEFNDDQNSTMDETVENFIGDLAAKQQHLRTTNAQMTPKVDDDRRDEGEEKKI